MRSFKIVMLVSGRIQKADSLFKYIDGTSYETFNGKSFTPIFVDDIISAMTDTERQLANDTCKGNNLECMFDLAVTGKTKAIEDISQSFKQIREINIVFINWKTNTI